MSGMPEPASVARSADTQGFAAAHVRPDEAQHRARDRDLSTVPVWARAEDEVPASGDGLPDPVRSWFEARMGADLADVRIHDDAAASARASALDAHAFTVGRDIYFAAGEYRPDTARGRSLLAHELGHATSAPGAGEHEANSVAHGALAGVARPAAVPRGRGASVPRLQSRTAPPADPSITAEHQALGQIHPLLSTGIFDWGVSDAEATRVLRILQGLAPDALLRTVADMRMSGDWSTFRRELPRPLVPQLYQLDERVDRHQGYLTANDHITLEAGPGRAVTPEINQDLTIDSDGLRVPMLTTPVPVRGLLPQAAADAIAVALVRGLIYAEPRVRIVVTSRSTLYGAYAGPTPGRVWYDAAPVAVGAAERARRDLQATFFAYVSTVHPSSDLELTALSRYLDFVQDNTRSAQLARIQPPELWAQMLREAGTRPPQTPEQTQRSDWLRFMQARRTAIEAMSDVRERERESTALRLLLDFYDSHGPSGDVAVRYGGFLATATGQAITAQMQAETVRRQRAADAADDDAAVARFGDYLTLSLRLRAMGQEGFPYRIPVPSEGVDILVTGAPARQRVLNDLADELFAYATNHVHDPDFRRSPPEMTLATLLRGGYQQRLARADAEPVTHEVFDRNEILAGRAAAAFGRTVAVGLLVIALVGAAVGAGIITAPVALVVLGLAAAGVAVKSYLDRRNEIEAANASVPVPATMVHSIGDVVGLSQLIEGITGERLGTDRALGSARRSDTLGEGAGSIALLIAGGRAYRSGELIGEAVRPRSLPTGPNGAAVTPAADRPVVAEPAARPGPLEDQTRSAVPADQRVGFDQWMAEIRRNNGNPETVLERIGARRQAEATRQAARRTTELQRAFAAERAARRSTDDPLRPILHHNETIPGTRVTLRYDSRPPSASEQSFGRVISEQTGEPVELFGDNASGQSYPGIDGTIGSPPRPLQLKSASPAADPNFARWAAGDAYAKALSQRYSHVEVHIDMPGSTPAQVRAAWDAPAPQAGQQANRTIWDASRTIARYVIHCRDGAVVTMEPPLGPALPGLAIPGTGSGDSQRR